MPIREIRQQFEVRFRYPVIFTEGLFDPANPVLANQVEAGPASRPRILIVLDSGMLSFYSDLYEKIARYLESALPALDPVAEPFLMPGGEESKNRPELIEQLLDTIEKEKLDRHSYLLTVGGGAVIDAAGYAAAIAHRGIRMIRVPTTVLAQNDAAIGVKTGVNAYGKKNFLGTFSPPHAVLNDFAFLSTLDDRDWRSGIAEAIKVAMIRDADFFRIIESNAGRLTSRRPEPMRELIMRCAELHLNHISGSGDPFEKGSSRPLDFGHWAGHKLEQLSGYRLRHGEAVAAGIALDSTYGYLEGRFPEPEWQRTLRLFSNCGFDLWPSELIGFEPDEHPERLLEGLDEFREHLGGELTLMLPESIGRGVEVHRVDRKLYLRALKLLRSFENQPV